MVTWEYQHISLAPDEDHYQTLRLNGLNGWEAWHIERDGRGWRTIYFKRKKGK